MEKPNDAKMGTDPPTARRRRRWLLGFEFPLVEGFLGLVLVLWGANLWIKAKRNAETKRMEAALKTIVLPEVRFEETPLPEAIRQLNAMIHQANPALGEEIIQIRSDSSISYLDEIKITLTVREIPLGEALLYTSIFAGMRYKIYGRQVLIVPLHYDWYIEPRTPAEIPFDWVSWKFYDFRDYLQRKWNVHFRRWFASAIPPVAAVINRGPDALKPLDRGQ